MPHDSLTIGGQALIEGVMIRAPHCIAIAVRKPNGKIITKKEPYITLTKRVKIFGLPVIRGIVNIFESMALGIKALNFSAQEAFEDGEEVLNESRAKTVLGIISSVLSVIISIVLAIFLFKFIPLFITEKLRLIFPQIASSMLLFNVIDGLLRIAIFFVYILILSLMKSIRRVFEYHGAEHKAVFAYEKGLTLNPENVGKESPRHPRCGTSFIIIILIISILILSFVPRHPIFWLNLLRRLAVIPLIMGVGYEVLKYSAKFRHRTLMKLLAYPGLLTQYITTKEPDTAQMEVAIAAVKAAVEKPCGTS